MDEGVVGGQTSTASLATGQPSSRARRASQKRSTVDGLAIGKKDTFDGILIGSHSRPFAGVLPRATLHPDFQRFVEPKGGHGRRRTTTFVSCMLCLVCLCM